MSLEIVTGHTDDGLVFLRFHGTGGDDPRLTTTTVTIEPDMAEGVALKMLDACKKAYNLNKRPLIIGQDQTFKRG